MANLRRAENWLRYVGVQPMTHYVNADCGTHVSSHMDG